jgi:hypothetical protein
MPVAISLVRLPSDSVMRLLTNQGQVNELGLDWTASSGEVTVSTHSTTELRSESHNATLTILGSSPNYQAIFSSQRLIVSGRGAGWIQLRLAFTSSDSAPVGDWVQVKVRQQEFLISNTQLESIQRVMLDTLGQLVYPPVTVEKLSDSGITPNDSLNESGDSDSTTTYSPVYPGYNPLCKDEASCVDVCGDAPLSRQGLLLDSDLNRQNCRAGNVDTRVRTVGNQDMSVNLGNIQRSIFNEVPLYKPLDYSDNGLCSVVDEAVQTNDWETSLSLVEATREVVCARCKKIPACVDEAKDLTNFEQLFLNGCCVERDCESTDNSDEKFIRYINVDSTVSTIATEGSLLDIANSVTFGNAEAPITRCGATDVQPVGTASRWKVVASEL